GPARQSRHRARPPYRLFFRPLSEPGRPPTERGASGFFGSAPATGFSVRPTVISSRLFLRTREAPAAPLAPPLALPASDIGAGRPPSPCDSASGAASSSSSSRRLISSR